ncbi:hypothetical protein HELRODRAFT_178699 [Helobdella robusta]|uniref:Uncharacterized protein n=1 Tax=Helobdella robusta TaxID=6412 RepID=T1FDL2_HELRO|nr:hypothetical protein HELRODRAFT_178699 [Helobdella robusta]ESN96900.1 hypothetical protein HELRODRAFT_178699 [Helobdella robusta]
MFVISYIHRLRQTSYEVCEVCATTGCTIMFTLSHKFSINARRYQCDSKKAFGFINVLHIQIHGTSNQKLKHQIPSKNKLIFCVDTEHSKKCDSEDRKLTAGLTVS